MVAHRKKLTSRERIAIHRKRFGGCGVFRKPNIHVSELAVGGGSARKGNVSDLIDGAMSPDQLEVDDSEYDDEM